jgi:hypothetical protein
LLDAGARDQTDLELQLSISRKYGAGPTYEGSADLCHRRSRHKAYLHEILDGRETESINRPLGNNKDVPFNGNRKGDFAPPVSEPL